MSRTVPGVGRIDHRRPQPQVEPGPGLSPARSFPVFWSCASNVLCPDLVDARRTSPRSGLQYPRSRLPGGGQAMCRSRPPYDPARPTAKPGSTQPCCALIQLALASVVGCRLADLQHPKLPGEMAHRRIGTGPGTRSARKARAGMRPSRSAVLRTGAARTIRSSDSAFLIILEEPPRSAGKAPHSRTSTAMRSRVGRNS